MTRDALRALLIEAYAKLDELCDVGPPGAGWQSEELIQLRGRLFDAAGDLAPADPVLPHAVEELSKRLVAEFDCTEKRRRVTCRERWPTFQTDWCRDCLALEAAALLEQGRAQALYSCDECEWFGPEPKRDPDGVTHCPSCGGTAINEPEGRAQAPAPADLVRLVKELQAHASEQGWQDVDDPIAALLDWRAAPSSPGDPRQK